MLLAVPSVGRADVFSFHVDVQDSHESYHDDFEDIDADIESLRAEVYRVEDGWELIVRYKVEVEDAPVGRCDLVFDLLDRDYPAPPIRMTVRLDQPTGHDDEEIIYSARSVTRIAPEHIRDPRHLRLHAYVVPNGGGPVLDHESTGVRFRH